MTSSATFEALKYRIVKNKNGIYYYNHSGDLHREEDLPAVIRLDNQPNLNENDEYIIYTWNSGGRWWYINGHLHRDGGKPAIIYSNGHKEWWVDGMRIK